MLEHEEVFPKPRNDINPAFSPSKGQNFSLAKKNTPSKLFTSAPFTVGSEEAMVLA